MRLSPHAGAFALGVDPAERIVEQAERAVREDKAEVICLGCGGMAGLGNALGVADMGEMMGKMGGGSLPGLPGGPKLPPGFENLLKKK